MTAAKREFDLLSMKPGDHLEVVLGNSTWIFTCGHKLKDHTHRVTGLSIMTNDERRAGSLGLLPSEIRVSRFLRLYKPLIVHTPDTTASASNAGDIAAAFLTTDKEAGIQVL